jgi:hypothetical protein
MGGNNAAGLPDFSTYNKPKPGNTYQMAIKYTK